MTEDEKFGKMQIHGEREVKPFNKLSDAEVAKFIAQKMGWMKLWDTEYRVNFFAQEQWDSVLLKHIPKWIIDCEKWNPMLSLDQCWIFEEWLLATEHTQPDEMIGNYADYICHLAKVCGSPKTAFGEMRVLCHAAARQRCEAFYVTMGGIEK